MALNKPDIVDAIGIENNTGFAVLTIADQWDWLDEHNRRRSAQSAGPGWPSTLNQSAMRTDTEIKNELLDALASVLDERLREVGFTRNKRSLIYTRKLDESEQQITFNLHCHPHYQPGAEAHICPTVQLLIPQITETALALVRGNKILLAGSPQTIVGQPIDFLAPKDKHERWFASTEEQFAACCEKIRAFLVQWVLPFFSEVSAPFDLIRLHEVDDERLVKADRWHIYVASAYKLLGQPDKAREVVLSRFGKPGLRKRYEALFQSLGIE